MVVRVGFIGVGGMGQAHFQNLSKLANVEIRGVCDINLELAHQVASSVGAKVYEDVHELITPANIDALFVCVPQFARDDIEIVAARKGIHLFVEKPLGLDFRTAVEKDRIIRETGVIHSSGYCLRYLETVQQAKSYLADKRIDMIVGHRHGGQYAPAWWKQMHLSGGQFVDQTTHQVDLARFVAGEFSEVYAQYEQRSIQLDDSAATIPDVGTVSMTMASGAIGTITNTCLANYAPRAELEFIGRDFQLFLDRNGASLRIADASQDVTVVSRIDPVLEQDTRFIRAVESGHQEEVLCSYTEALKTLAVTLAANESAEHKRAVSVRDLLG